MDIQFRCASVSHFDQQNGTYQTCNQLLQVSSDNVGLKVRCPRCNQMMVVPGRGVSKSISSSTEPKPEIAANETVAKVQSELSYGRFSRATRCPKCGSLLDDLKRCTACRYQTPLVKASAQPLSQIKVKPAGFQLWFREIMADGVGPRVFEYALHSLLLIVVLGLLIMAVAIGGSAAIYAAVVAAVLGILYLIVVIQTKRLATVPGARLPFYLKPFWNGLLRLARLQKWQNYDSRLRNRLIIDVRGQPFGDRDLLDLEKLNVCQVLDAEGTDITDNALAAMHGLKHLRCLVLRRTHVTYEGVFRLQQSLPRCWIWY